jgi:hypothetical protein
MHASPGTEVEDLSEKRAFLYDFFPKTYVPRRKTVCSLSFETVQLVVEDDYGLNYFCGDAGVQRVDRGRGG